MAAGWAGAREPAALAFAGMEVICIRFVIDLTADCMAGHTGDLAADLA